MLPSTSGSNGSKHDFAAGSAPAFALPGRVLCLVMPQGASCVMAVQVGPSGASWRVCVSSGVLDCPFPASPDSVLCVVMPLDAFCVAALWFASSRKKSNRMPVPMTFIRHPPAFPALHPAPCLICRKGACTACPCTACPGVCSRYPARRFFSAHSSLSAFFWRV